MNEDKLCIQGLYKSYKNGAHSLEVLKGINLSLKDRGFLAVEGPSGAGKSTLLHIVGGLDKPSSGEVRFDGVNIFNLKESERAIFRNRKIGFVFQFFHLLPELNTLENVILPALIRSWWERKRAIDYAQTLLDNLGLGERLRHRPNQLSGGEQQRVAIARALINRPEVLLCDEPTGNLDSENGKNILRLLKRLNKEEKLTVFLVTHDKDIARESDRVVYLKDGMILH